MRRVKRKMSRAAIMGMLASPKTPERLKQAWRKKLGMK